MSASQRLRIGISCIGLTAFILCAVSAAEIHDAVRNRDLGRVSAILLKDPSQANVTNNDISTSTYGAMPIHIAAEMDDTNMLALLLQSGARLEATNKNGFTALHTTAFVFPRVKAAKFLVEKGADVNANKAFKTMTPLHFAARSGSTELVQLLLDHGATTTQSVESPLNEAVNGGNAAIVELLLAHKANVNARDSLVQATPLIAAASRGLTNIVRVLLENKADINAQTKNGYTALMQAARYGRTGVAEMLLQSGANIALEDDTGRTALGWALRNDSGKPNPAIAELLEQHGADKVTSNVRRTSIHKAAAMGDLERVKTLLSQKPELAADEDSLFGETPLHIAAGTGRIEICKLLIANKANVNAKDSTGAMPLHAAAKGGHSAVVELLLTNNANPLAVDSEGRTVLHMAAWSGNTNVIQTLIDRKADINAKEKNGSTALDIADFLGHNGAVQLLKAKPRSGN
jgi:ankyrin repeat protein